MNRSHFFIVTALISLAACSDNPAGIEYYQDGGVLPLPPQQMTVAGRISVTGSGVDRLIQLATGAGDTYTLVGTEARKLASVAGGEVVVHGTLDANPGLVVDKFQVTAMHGYPALDGILESGPDGYMLRLQDGSTWPWPDTAMSRGAPPVGARIWLIGFTSEGPTEFGVIEDQ